MHDIKPALMTLVVFTVLCGGIYPALVTGLAQAVFPRQAAGSLLMDGQGRTVGSELVGQAFTGPGYFWPRPSATVPSPYYPLASGGSNLGPTNPALREQVAARLARFQSFGGGQAPPADLLLASASGLDPHISPEAALAQVARVARVRGMAEAMVRRLVAAQTEGRTWGFLGAPRVNVLRLNLGLDAAAAR